MSGPRIEPAAEFLVLDERDLPQANYSRDFQGYRYGDTSISFIWVDMAPGDGVRLHRHPYEEIFIVQEGQATYTVGSTTLEVRSPRVLIVRPGVPHKFVNSGNGPLRQVDIHLSERFITEWLEG